MANTMTVYGRTYELDFSQEGSVLLTWKSQYYTYKARIRIDRNQAGLPIANSHDLLLSDLAKRTRAIIKRKLEEMVEEMDQAQEEATEVAPEPTQEVAEEIVVTEIVERINGQVIARELDKRLMPSARINHMHEQMTTLRCDYEAYEPWKAGFKGHYYRGFQKVVVTVQRLGLIAYSAREEANNDTRIVSAEFISQRMGGGSTYDLLDLDGHSVGTAFVKSEDGVPFVYHVEMH